MSLQNEKRGERAMKLKKDKNDYSAEAIKQRRKFPVKNTIIIAICVIAQIALAYLAITQTAEPQDVIEKYQVDVEVRDDGSLDIEYTFLWKAIDETEELSWVEIGLPNAMFTVYEDSVSGNIKEYTGIYDDGYTGLRLDFQRGYKGGENIQFSFKVNQQYMLCQDNWGYFYEFVPCWFNSTPVENYEFKWKKTDNCDDADGAKLKHSYYIWSGSLDCGEYEVLKVDYDMDAFNNDVVVVEYEPFYADGAYNELESNKNTNRFLFCAGIVVLLFVEIYRLDSHVSYRRGRGFLRGYGYPIHTYGYQNPKYIRAYNRAHTSTSSRGGGFRGGGCACACACACAGGGRAGCSQKDTYSNIEVIKKD